MFVVTKATITHILPIQSGESANGGWSKIDIIAQIESGQYPKSACFTIFNPKDELLDKLKVGAEATINFSIDCREYKEKWYNSVSAFKVEITKAIAEPVRQANRTAAAAKVEPQRIVRDDDSGDLPF